MKSSGTSRWMVVILVALAMIVTMAGAAAALSSKGLPKAAVTIDGQKLSANGYNRGGRVVVPMRAIFEQLDATVEWNAQNRTVTATKNTTVIKLTIDKTAATVGDKAVTLEAPPVIIDGKTYVPVRFVSEALGCKVEWDPGTYTVKITTAGQDAGKTVVHEGAVNPQGETWSPGTIHIVRGEFMVEGEKSPVLTIEAGTVVRFEKGACLIVGESAPGGLVVEGDAAKPVVLTAAIAGAYPGYWDGVKFGEQTMRDNASISGTRIEYAGGQYRGGICVESGRDPVEVLVKNTKVSGSATAGLELSGEGRLQSGSTGNQFTGNDIPVKLSPEAVGCLEPGNTFTGNKKDWILVAANAGRSDIKKDITWRNLGVPYKVEISIDIGGSASPVLTVEAGANLIFMQETGFEVGQYETGSLVAVGAPGRPVIFTSVAKRAGSWDGIHFGDYAGAGNRLENVTIEYAKTGVETNADLGAFIKNTTIRNSSDFAIFRGYGADGTSFVTGLGNQFEGNAQDENE